MLACFRQGKATLFIQHFSCTRQPQSALGSLYELIIQQIDAVFFNAPIERVTLIIIIAHLRLFSGAATHGELQGVVHKLQNLYSQTQFASSHDRTQLPDTTPFKPVSTMQDAKLTPHTPSPWVHRRGFLHTGSRMGHSLTEVQGVHGEAKLYNTDIKSGFILRHSTWRYCDVLKYL